MALVTITDDDMLTAVRSFLLGILPVGVEVVLGQDNRVPEPIGDNFVVMTPMLRRRLSTNYDDSRDNRFTAMIAGTTMTVSAVNYGEIEVGHLVFGVDVAANTTVVALGTGTGGTGTYTIAPAQTVSSEVMAAGTIDYNQHTEVTVQLDVHGRQSANNAQIITTLFRDQYAVDQFTASGFDIAPLYADEARQMPFKNAEQQWEYRYIVDAHLQINPTVTLPQQYADIVNVELIDVDVVYPPT